MIEVAGGSFGTGSAGRRWLALAVLLVALLPVPGRASPGEGLVQGETAVADRSDGARAAGLAAALADAFGRLTPEEAPGSRVDAAALLAADESLLKRFEYAQVTRPTASGIPSIKLVLRAWFDAAAAREALVRSGLAVWRGGGVAATIWLVEDAAGGRRLLELSAAPFAGFRAQLAERGVDAHGAINDLEDWRMAEALTSETAADALAQAVARTQADPAVLAWARQDAEGVGIEWQVANRNATRHFVSAGATLEAALAAGVARLIGVLAEHQAVRPGSIAEQARAFDRGAGEYVVWLENLHRAGVYVEAVSLLQAQAVVAALIPEQAAGDRVRVRLTLNAPLTQLISLLAADGRLALSPTAPGDADLSLRWQN